ncbi:hypothetical protein [Shewanella litorisediminis]|uniref:DUF4034 domain-containing protein n=1 Tax=Shewanella litorisediminis TaxID=1173586 RepID=A0ABX7G2L7_9GAMM|nr:hypothetical protein [Shewanella litorisediminis]MCL2917071.1 hypothetical protein [Shewanella litorisediminis]QRH01551.1 hypothetical protein JQC75_17155 [Shewanella litorisediminis]
MLKPLVYWYVRIFGQKTDHDPALGYGRIAEFEGWLRNRDWPQFEDAFDAISRGEQEVLIGYFAVQADAARWFGPWLRASSSPIPALFEGRRLLIRAWKERSGLTIDYLPQSAVRKWQRWGNQAVNVLQQARDISPRDLRVRQELLWAQAATGDAWVLAQETLALLFESETADLPLGMTLMQILNEKWFGGDELDEQVARALASRNPAYNSLLVSVWVERWLSAMQEEVPFADHYFMQEHILDELRALAITDTCLTGPDKYLANIAANFYAFAFFKGREKMLASKYLLQVRDKYLPEPWQYESSPRTAINSARRFARLGNLTS